MFTADHREDRHPTRKAWSSRPEHCMVRIRFAIIRTRCPICFNTLDGISQLLYIVSGLTQKNVNNLENFVQNLFFWTAQRIRRAHNPRGMRGTLCGTVFIISLETKSEQYRPTSTRQPYWARVDVQLWYGLPITTYCYLILIRQIVYT